MNLYAYIGLYGFFLSRSQVAGIRAFAYGNKSNRLNSNNLR